MKKIILTSTSVLILTAITLIIASSFKKDGDPVYSCDPNIDAWVKSNKAKIETLSRHDVSFLAPDTGLGVLHCMSASRKYSLWKEKIAFDYLTLSENEKPYFDKLTNKYSNEIYTNENARVEFENFAKEWTTDVKAHLGWSDIKIFVLTNVMATEEEWRTIVERRTALGSKFSCSGSGETCCCLYSASCNPGFNCVTISCGSNYQHDCGVFGTSACTGVCQ